MIINPMYFYKLRVCDMLSQTACILSVLSLVVVLVFGIWGTFEVMDNQIYGPDDKDYKNGKKLLKWTAITAILMAVFWILYILIPDKETLLEMQIAKYATFENAEWTLDKLKEAVDYIVSKIGELK